MPATSKAQFRFMKAVESGSVKKKGLSKEKAKEFTSENKSLKNLPEKKDSKGDDKHKDKAKKHSDKHFEDKDKASKTDPYHGHEGSDHEHLSNRNLRGANKAYATRKVKIQQNHESC